MAASSVGDLQAVYDANFAKVIAMMEMSSNENTRQTEAKTMGDLASRAAKQVAQG